MNAADHHEAAQKLEAMATNYLNAALAVRFWRWRKRDRLLAKAVDFSFRAQRQRDLAADMKKSSADAPAEDPTNLPQIP